MILWFSQYQFSHTSIFENVTLILDNSTVVLLVVLVAVGVVVVVGARVLKARKLQQP
jgi:hypothetical protein